ncbi:MAG: tetratricopeptide repeat protein [Pyrinomonadaceae bacterium]
MRSIYVSTILIFLVFGAASSGSGQTAKEFLERSQEKAFKDPAGALADINEAIRIDPALDEAWNQRAILYSFRKDYKSAVTDYSKAIELKPKDANYYSNRAGAYIKLDDLAKALPDYDTEIELWPTNEHAWMDRGKLRTKMKQYQLAIDDFNHSLTLMPQLFVNYQYRAEAYRGLGKTALADADDQRYAVEKDNFIKEMEKRMKP